MCSWRWKSSTPRAVLPGGRWNFIRDDRGLPSQAGAVDRELMDAGVAAIIGHATSGQTVAGLTVTNPARIVPLSPTTSSGSERKIRILFPGVSDFSGSARGFAQYIYRKRTFPAWRLYMILTMPPTPPPTAAFLPSASVSGGLVTFETGFSWRLPDFAGMASAAMKEAGADAVLIITSDMDAAMIAQRVRLMNWQVPLFASAWAQTDALIYHGGPAVEGMEIEQAYMLDSPSPDFVDFKQRYQERFDSRRPLARPLAMRARWCLPPLWKRPGERVTGLRPALLAPPAFKGLVDSFVFDPNGDVVRPFYLSVICEGRFEIMGRLTSADR